MQAVVWNAEFEKASPCGGLINCGTARKMLMCVEIDRERKRDGGVTVAASADAGEVANLRSVKNPASHSSYVLPFKSSTSTSTSCRMRPRFELDRVNSTLWPLFEHL